MSNITNQRKYRVLMADDEFMILKGLERMIDWDGLNLELAATASHGEEALTIIQRQPIDIIITDINMPRLTGIEFIEQLQNSTHRTEFIFISGYEKFEYVKSGLTLGASDYLLKPIDRTELQAALQKVIDRLNTYYQIKAQQHVLRKQQIFDWLRSPYQPDTTIEGLSEPLTLLVLTHNESQEFEVIVSHYEQSVDCLILQKLPSILIVLKLNATATITGEILKQNRFPNLNTFHQWYQIFERRMDNLSFYGQETLIQYLFEMPVKEKEPGIASFIAKIYHHLDQHQLVQVGDDLTQLAEIVTFEAVNQKEVIQILQAFINYFVEDKPRLTETTTLEAAIQQTAELLRIKPAQVKYDRLHPIIQEALVYIDGHLASEITLKHLADQLHINVMYLGQLFKKELNQSFSKYINQLRIEKSKDLLLKTTLTIAEVGHQVGYQNQAYFYRMFKEAEGISPKEYRQQILGND